MPSPQLALAVRDYITSKRSSFSKTTAAARESLLLKFIASLDCTTLASIAPANVEQWYHRRLQEIKPSSADTQLKAVRRFFQWLTQTRRLRTDPSVALKPGGAYTDSSLEFCSAEDVERLLAAAPSTELRFVILCGFDLGMKTTEIATARWRWFRHRNETKWANVENQRQSTRSVPLTLRMLDLIISLSGDHDAAQFVLKPEVDRRTLDRRGLDIEGAFADLAAEQGIPGLRIGVLRESFAVRHVSAGVQLARVARWMGTTRHGIVSRYGHFSKSDV